jgi:ABC-type Na+ efflux pump permease subunit
MSMSTVWMAAQAGQSSFRRAWIITRREVRDTMRDWRLVIPIALLTIVFPALMQFTANMAQQWVMRWGGAIIGERIIPFLMMIVGFFPISFSLVIALETFVGEKERHSLEPLLATPLTNAELYWGKMMAAMIPPLGASYLGLAVYLVGLWLTLDWLPSAELLALVILLTTAEALVMVSGAVVISSQTTSVRAANILASFVIIPMALLVQGESVIMFWADYDVLWWFVATLLTADLLLVRMGIQLFNREELLGRDIDQLDVKKAWGHLVQFLVTRDKVAF